MQTTQPLELEGNVYPLLNANLAITSSYKNGQFEACAAMRLVPTRLDENGNGITSDENGKSIIIGTLDGISGPEQEALTKIYEAVQNYIVAKGL